MILCSYNFLLVSCHIDCCIDFTCFLIVRQSQLTISDVARKAFLHSVCDNSLDSGFIVFFASFLLVAQPELLLLPHIYCTCLGYKMM
jgi:hypothetical protein